MAVIYHRVPLQKLGICQNLRQKMCDGQVFKVKVTENNVENEKQQNPLNVF